MHTHTHTYSVTSWLVNTSRIWTINETIHIQSLTDKIVNNTFESDLEHLTRFSHPQPPIHFTIMAFCKSIFRLDKKRLRYGDGVVTLIMHLLPDLILLLVPTATACTTQAVKTLLKQSVHLFLTGGAGWLTQVDLHNGCIRWGLLTGDINNLEAGAIETSTVYKQHSLQGSVGW